ncbi:MAG: AAA family ATPase [Deferribacterales bacterium]
MANITINIHNIKGISSANLELPLENGVYALVGGNGTGKSTILQCIAQLIRPQNALLALKPNDYKSDSSVEFFHKSDSDKWFYSKKGWRNQIYQSNRRKDAKNNIPINGMYEGSLFVGTRFMDSKQVDYLVANQELTSSDLVPADDYVIKKLSYILHGDLTHYASLKRLKNRELKEKNKLKNLPYFVESSFGGLISQYRMSSGECLLVSLLHFIYNAIIRSSLPINLPIIMLLDEIELALHPVAVSRFLDLIEEITKKYLNVVAILTTHAPEVIRRIEPSNIYKLENDNGDISVINPCYPSYAIRELYTHDKYDYLVLCEDALAKKLINSIIAKNNACTSKLVCVLPVGGWENVLKLQLELVKNKILGVGTQVISVLDGDIQHECKKKTDYDSLKKLFLPIASIEKFLFSIIYEGKDKVLRKIIGDKYFQLQSLEELISQFNKNNENMPKQPNKSFYKMLKDNLSERKISEDVFIDSLCDDIKDNRDLSKFTAQLIEQIK